MQVKFYVLPEGFHSSTNMSIFFNFIKTEFRMRLIIFFISLFLYSQLSSSQASDFSSSDYNNLLIKIDTITNLKIYKNSDSFNLQFSEAVINLNKRLRESSFELIENNSMDYIEYLRGCGPLDDGITNKVNSRSLMLSMAIDNFVNKVIFKGKGVFFKTNTQD